MSNLAEMWDLFTADEIILMHTAWERSEGKTDIALLPFKPISGHTMRGVLGDYVRLDGKMLWCTVMHVKLEELYAKLTFPELWRAENDKPS